jgi:MarR family transcriptional regulator, organic hydroperoxide resistance regulator
MEQKKYEELVENLYVILPLIKKKLVKQDLYEEEIELNPPHFHILFALEEGGMLTVTELGKALNISKTNVTPLVQKLIDKELVNRIYDEVDRRYIRIDLTAAGKEFLSKHKNLVIKNLKTKITKFNEEDLEKLSSSLQNLKELLEKLD